MFNKKFILLEAKFFFAMGYLILQSMINMCKYNSVTTKISQHEG